MNIRLTENEIQGIVSALKKHIKKAPASLYLYGSRTKLNTKGGDIDLLLLFSSAADKESCLEIKHIILADIKNTIGDQKIDLLISEKNALEHDEFLKVIFPGSVLISVL